LIRAGTGLVSALFQLSPPYRQRPGCSRMDYKIGIIGCGGMGKAHIGWWNMLENCQVTAICDILPEAMDAAEQISGPVARYEDYEQMLDEAGVNIVSIATWPNMHAPPTIAAARRGVHIYCEKPMALDLEECDAMIEACDENGVSLIIGHNRRNDPRFDKAKRLIEEGFIGQVRMIQGQDKGYEAGYGMMNMGSHLFDSMHILFGDVEWVWGHLRKDGRPVTPEDIETDGHRGTGYIVGETATIYLQFQNGVAGIAEWIPDFDQTRYGVEIIGSEGRLALKNPARDLYHYPEPVYGPTEWQSWEQIELTPEENPYDYPHRSTAERLCREMLAHIEGGPEPSSCGREAMKAIEIVMAVHESNRRGCIVRLPLTDRRHPLKVWREEAGLQ